SRRVEERTGMGTLGEQMPSGLPKSEHNAAEPQPNFNRKERKEHREITAKCSKYAKCKIFPKIIDFRRWHCKKAQAPCVSEWGGLKAAPHSWLILMLWSTAKMAFASAAFRR